MASRSILAHWNSFTLSAFCIVLFSFGTFSIKSDSIPGFEIRYYDELNMLPDDTISDLLEDQFGRIWIATSGGIAVFDGTQMEIYTRSNNSGLLDNNVLCLEQTPDGTIWAGTQTQGIFRWTGTRFVSHAETEALRGNEIISIVTISGSRTDVWISSKTGLKIYKPSESKLINASEGINGEFGHVVYLQDGKTYVHHSRGISRKVPNNDFFEPIAIPELYPNSIEIRWINLGADKSFGVFWNNPENNQRDSIFQFTYAQEKWALFKTDQSFWEPDFFKTYLQSHKLPAQHIDVFIERSLLSLRDYAIYFNAPNNAPIGPVRTVLTDHESNIWIAFEENGLIQMLPKPVEIITGLMGDRRDNLWAVCQSANGDIIVGGNGGVALVTSEEKVSKIGLPGELGEASVRALAFDSEGTLWAGTGHDLFYYENSHWHLYNFLDGIKETKVRVLFSNDSDRTLWIGHTHGITILKDHRTIEHISVKNGLPLNDVRTIEKDDKGNIWVGTYGGGLAYWDGSNFHKLTQADGLGSNYVWGLHAEPQGTLWAATEGGLSRIQGSKVFNFTTEHGLHMNAVNDVTSDDHGRLWITSDQGVYVDDLASFEIVAQQDKTLLKGFVLNESDGFLNAESNGQKSQPAVWKSENGNILIPTVRGLGKADTGRLDHIRSPNKVFLKSVTASGRSIDIEASLPHKTSFQVPPGQGIYLEFNLSCPSFVLPESIRFFYRPVGTSEWTSMEKRRTLMLTHLDPGTYAFEFQVQDHHRLWAEQPLVVEFTVVPSFFQSTLFKILCATTIGLALWGSWTVRSRYMRRTLELESIKRVHAEKQRIAEDLHDDLGTDLTKLMLTLDNAQRAYTKGNDPQNNLSAAQKGIKRLGWKLRQFAWTIQPDASSLISLIDQVCMEMDEQLGVARIRSIQEIADLPENDMLLPETRHELFSMSKEIISNTLKHSSASYLMMTATCESDHLRLTFADDGIGFDSSAPSNGKGLRNLIKRAERIQANCSIESQKTGSTKIVIRVKIKTNTQPNGSRI